MPYKLSEEQQRRIIELCSPEDSEFFFSDIEYMMREAFFPAEGAAKHVLKEKVRTLEKVSKSAKKLLNDLNVLDPYLLGILDSELGKKLGTPYYHESIKVGGQPALCYPNLSTRTAIRTIVEEASFHSADLLTHYGSNHMEWFTKGLWVAWTKSVEPEIKTSASSKFIKYLAIVLNGDPETISKQVQRTRWFKSYKKYSRDKNREKS